MGELKTTKEDFCYCEFIEAFVWGPGLGWKKCLQEFGQSCCKSAIMHKLWNLLL
jgi:hypothetical protein